MKTVRKKLAIITSHPIQYYAPIFQLLAKEIELKVFYTGGKHFNNIDLGFDKKINWDIPLLEGYSYSFLKNISKEPGSHHFNGIVNTNAITEINDFHPDTLLIYGWAYKSHLKIIRHFKDKIPVYFRGDSTLIDKRKGYKSLLKKYLLKWVYKHIDTAFYVGNANKEYFKSFGLENHQLIYAPHSIDNDRFAKNRIQEADSVRKKFKIKEDEILILFAGKFEQKKNPEILLQAFLELNIPNTHLLFVGNGVLEKNIKLQVDIRQTQDDKVDEKLKVTSRVHFMDFQNQTQMPVIYQACDLFCLPSKGPGETWGLAVNEAMAASKAILVSNKVGCFSDLVFPSVNGDIFKSENLTDLKTKLLSLVQNKNQLLKMGNESKKIIKNWSFEEQVKSIVKAINLL